VIGERLKKHFECVSYREAAYDLQQYIHPPDYLQMDPPCSLGSVNLTKRKSVIELGSVSVISLRHWPIDLMTVNQGTGVGGLAAADIMQAEDLVVLTDLEAVLPLLEINHRRDMERRAKIQGRPAAEVWIRALPWGDSRAAEAILSELRACGRNITQILCSDLVLGRCIF
jgi:hypothetical protein